MHRLYNLAGDSHTLVFVLERNSLALHQVLQIILLEFIESAHQLFSRLRLLGTHVLCVDTLSLIHISEPTRPLYISYAVFCLKKKKKQTHKKDNSILTEQSQGYKQ
eukprot:TRINITY_DN16822_c0_g1_i1.p1 TRINITY_DN16822_c0_g1~~TRINITY_DN16822_c0_g1_i1.p1  ORF type:complete len:106 (-),score=8.28 TRINITY_DN16822_c0_g1_i1:19-336(-)